jgi:hypothetical protein
MRVESGRVGRVTMRKGLLFSAVAIAVAFVPAVAAAQSLEAALAPHGSPAAGFVLAAALGLALRMGRR